jgi:hypothetical protein
MSDKIDGKWKTWNPVIGCLHSCSYCWAKRFALERLSDTEKFIEWIEDIAPIHVSVGYDNYGNRLPEPPLSKTLQLIERLSEFTEVRKLKLRESWDISNAR